MQGHIIYVSPANGLGVGLVVAPVHKTVLVAIQNMNTLIIVPSVPARGVDV